MKRILCGILALLAVFICAACSAAMQAPAGQASDTVPSTAPQSTAAVSGPVTVTETHANNDAVPVRPAPSAAPTAAPDTPPTGEAPVVPLAGALGLILLCSAGLIMLKRF